VYDMWLVKVSWAVKCFVHTEGKLFILCLTMVISEFLFRICTVSSSTQYARDCLYSVKK